MVVECTVRETLVRQSPLTRRRWFLQMLVRLLMVWQVNTFTYSANTRGLHLCSR